MPSGWARERTIVSAGKFRSWLVCPWLRVLERRWRSKALPWMLVHSHQHVHDTVRPEIGGGVLQPPYKAKGQDDDPWSQYKQSDWALSPDSASAQRATATRQSGHFRRSLWMCLLGMLHPASYAYAAFPLLRIRMLGRRTIGKTATISRTTGLWHMAHRITCHGYDCNRFRIVG